MTGHNYNMEICNYNMEICKMMKIINSYIIAVLCCLAVSYGSAAEISWNVSTGNWATASNWSSAQVPAGDNKAKIQNGGTCVVDTVAAPVSNLTVSGNSLLIVNAGGQLNITNLEISSCGLIVDGGAFTNQGPAFNAGGVSITVTNGGSFHKNQWWRLWTFNVVVDNSYARFQNSLEAWDGSANLNFTVRSGATIQADTIYADEGRFTFNVEGAGSSINLGNINTGTNVLNHTFSFVVDDVGISTVNCGAYDMSVITNATTLVVDGTLFESPFKQNLVLIDSTALAGVFTITNLINCTGDIVYDYDLDQVRFENFRGPVFPTVILFR